jgi:hypothetical protein
LHAQRPALVDDGGQERVVDVTSFLLLHEDTIAARDILDFSGCTGQKRPAGQVGAVRFAVFAQNLRCVALGVDVIETKYTREPKSLPSFFCNPTIFAVSSGQVSTQLA